MRYLLDTQAFIWASRDTDRLRPAVLDLLADPENEVLLSSAVIWEIAIKRAQARLAYPLEAIEAIASMLSLKHWSIRFDHAIEAGQLPPHHKDPFDRVLIAQARRDDLILVTSDQSIMRYDVRFMDAAR